MRAIASLLAFALLSSYAAASDVSISVDVKKPEACQVAATWYAGWHAADFPLSKMSWEKYTHVTYAFAETAPNVHALSLSADDKKLLPQFVQAAQKHGVKALVSIGGWTGSRYFSSDVATAKNRTAFVKTVVDFVNKYNLDGIDFDWEYPGTQGIGCNVLAKKDVSHYLTFLQDLRKDPVGKTLYLTAAASLFPWAGPSGDPMEDVSGFAKVLDHIAIMNYDVWGAWTSTTGPNAPLNDTCAPADSQAGSAVSAVAAWHAAGIPYDQLVLGVAAYGHSWTVAPKNAFINGKNGELKLFAEADSADPPTGDAWDDAAGVDECGNVSGPGGLWDFWGLVKAGWLDEKGIAKTSVSYKFDLCSQTPVVYNETARIMVTYDNAQSFAAKGKFIKDLGMKGFATWEAGGDYKDILLDSIRGAIGFKH